MCFHIYNNLLLPAFQNPSWFDDRNTILQRCLDNNEYRVSIPATTYPILLSTRFCSQKSIGIGGYFFNPSSIKVSDKSLYLCLTTLLANVLRRWSFTLSSVKSAPHITIPSRIRENTGWAARGNALLSFKESCTHWTPIQKMSSSAK